AATKVIVSHLPSGTAPITRTPRGARPLSLTIVRADGGLVDKHQPGRIKHTLLSYPAAARSRHICSLPFGCLQHFFFSVMLCRSRKRQSELRLVLIRRLRSSATVAVTKGAGRLGSC